MSYYSEIELYSSRGPGSPHRNVAELDHMVVIDEFQAPSLVHGTPDLSTDLREDRNRDPVVFQKYRRPLLVLPY